MTEPASGELQVIYDTTVTAVGAMVPEFQAAGLLILFGDIAPEELHDFVALHRATVTEGTVEPGDVIDVEGQELVITAVGSVAVQNLQLLGHISIKADGATVAALPGDISVEAAPLPTLSPGARVRIIRRSPHAHHN